MWLQNPTELEAWVWNVATEEAGPRNGYELTKKRSAPQEDFSSLGSMWALSFLLSLSYSVSFFSSRWQLPCPLSSFLWLCILFGSYRQRRSCRIYTQKGFKRLPGNEVLHLQVSYRLGSPHAWAFIGSQVGTLESACLWEPWQLPWQSPPGRATWQDLSRVPAAVTWDWILSRH